MHLIKELIYLLSGWLAGRELEAVEDCRLRPRGRVRQARRRLRLDPAHRKHAGIEEGRKTGLSSYLGTASTSEFSWHNFVHHVLEV